MKLKTNLRGQVRQTPLPKWKSLLPLFEAIMNAYQAIQEADPARDHSIIIDCERETNLGLEPQDVPFTKFTVSDTGVGFNDVNFDSFNTAFSEYKYERGGKGLGRIMWLVAFERAEIVSIFKEDDADHPWSRNFIFDTNYEPDSAPAVAIDGGHTGTAITLSGFSSPYKEECPRTAEVLAQRIIERFILVLLAPNCPRIEIRSDGIKHSVNDIFLQEYQANASEYIFSVQNKTFIMHGFKKSHPQELTNIA